MFGSTNPFGQSSNSPFGSQSVFGQTNNASSNPFAPKPFGSTTPFGSQTGGSIFGGTSTGVFGATQSSAPLTSTPAFGVSPSPGFGSSAPAFGASSTPAFGSSSSSFGSSSVFGQKPAFGSFGSSTPQTNPFGGTFQQSQPAFGSSLFGSTPFGASSQPAFGTSSTPAFGSTSTPAFGATSSPAFGATSTPAFGSTASPAFGSTGTAFGVSNASVFGSGGAFVASSTPVFGSSSTQAFGAPSTPAFGASSSPAFGASSTPAFGTSSAPSFSFGSTPAFSQSASAFASSPFSTSTSPFGVQSSSFGAQATTPTFGSPGFGQAAFGGQRGGTRVAAYTPTTELDSGTGTQPAGKLESISAMPVYKDKSHEELKWEDYQLGDKGGPAPAGQSTCATGFGATPTQSNPFASSLAFGQSSGNPFSSSTPSNPFAKKTPAFGSTGFGSSSTAFNSSPFGASSTSNPFGSTSSGTSSIFGASGSAFGTNTSPSLFGSASSPAFGTSTSIFGSASAPGTASAFGYGLSFANTPTFGSPGLGQAAFGGQRGGTRVAAYTPTAELDIGTGTQLAEKLESISAMLVYKDKSHEELRWEDYQLVDKGGPAPAGQSTGATGFGATPTQSNPFASSSAFGQSFANPFSSSTPSNPFAQKTPAFGSIGFGSSSAAFNSSPFGASSTSNPFGSTSSGTSSIFGASGSAFGINTSPSLFGSASSPAFGTSTSIFGSASAPGTASAFGYGLSFANAPTFGNPGLGQAAFGGQRGGTRVAAYTSTAELDIGTGTQVAEKLESISAMPVYKDKSHEELRWEDYQLGDKGGPAPAGQSTGAIGFGATPTQSNPFASSSAFGQSSANPFSSSTPSNPFGQKTPAFGSTGFGSSSAAFNSSPFGGASSTSNPFGSTSSGTTSIFGASGSAFGTNTSPSLFGSASSPAFGTSTSIFGSASAPGTASAFGSGLSFANTQSSPLFQSSTPSLGQTNSLFGQNAPSFGQNTQAFGQSSLFNTPSTGFGGNLFSSTPSLLSTSNPVGFGQTTPSLSTPFQSVQPAQTTGSLGFGNFGQTQQGGAGSFGNMSSIFGQNTFGQMPATQSSAVAQAPPVNNPFGTLPAMPQMSIGRSGTAPSIQYGISSLPVVDKPAPVRISSLLTSRHLSQRRIRLPARKYHPRNDGPKVPFFNDDEETPSTPKADALFIPRENPRALVIRPLEQWPPRKNVDKSSPLKDTSSPAYENGKIAEVDSTSLNGSSANHKNKEPVANGGIVKERVHPDKGDKKLNGIHDDHSNGQKEDSYITLTGHRAGEAAIVFEHGADIEALMPKLRHSDYYTEPRIQELAAMERAKPGFCCRVKDFVVGRHGYGSIKFIGETDVRRLDLESLIQFNNREVIVYMDESKKPPVGQGLNKPAEVTLLNIKCIDRKTGNHYTGGPKIDRYREMLKRKAEDQGAEFVSYDPIKGEWKFRVNHFSKYRLGDEDED